LFYPFEATGQGDCFTQSKGKTMSIILVTYDLVSPGRNYQPVYDYLKKHTYCKGLESVWLLDTAKSTKTIRDEMTKLVDSKDKLFMVRLRQDWGSYNFGCADWLNQSERSWD
jgi:hypothetical protein